SASGSAEERLRDRRVMTPGVAQAREGEGYDSARRGTWTRLQRPAHRGWAIGCSPPRTWRLRPNSAAGTLSTLSTMLRTITPRRPCTNDWLTMPSTWWRSAGARDESL